MAQMNGFLPYRIICEISLLLSVNKWTFFYDNRDNNDYRNNGRNGLCHEEKYNWDNKITFVSLFFFASSRKLSFSVLYTVLSG